MPCLVGPDSGCVSESHAPCDALERAFRVRSYVDVRLLLGLQATGASIRGGVPGCPADCRSRLLSALGGRLMALRYPEQSLAIRDFLASDHAAGSSGLLGELQAAALSGVAGLRQREQALVRPGGAARSAVERGENVQAVARRCAISGQEALDALESAALPGACRAVVAGASVDAVAHAQGITSPAGRQELERHATGHVGIAVVRQGACPIAAARRLGIRSPRCTRVLQLEAARRLVSRGHPVADAARAHGIGDEGARLALEMLARQLAERATHRSDRGGAPAARHADVRHQYTVAQESA